MSTSRNRPWNERHDDDSQDPNRTIPLDDDRTEVIPSSSAGRIDEERTEVLDEDRTEYLSEDDNRTQVLDGGSWGSGNASANETLPLPAYGEGSRSMEAQKYSGLEYDDPAKWEASGRGRNDDATQVLGRAEPSGRYGAGAGGASAAGAGAGAAGAAGSSAAGPGMGDPYAAGSSTTGFPQGGQPGGFAPEPPRAPSGAELRTMIVRRQKAEYGRIQLLPGLIGWLVATAVAGFLLWLAGQVNPSIGSVTMPDAVGSSLKDLTQGSAGGGAWVLVFGAVYFVSYVAGGFAAGRAGRFAGAKQGVAVWLWQLMGAAVTTVLSLFLADRVGTSVPLGSVQSLGGGDFLWGLAAAVCALIVGLIGAILGGLWGTRFHRSVDRWGFEGR